MSGILIILLQTLYCILKFVTYIFKDVVFALAHATGKSGRFTLIERWRSNERVLAPNENPLKVNCHIN